MVALLKDISSYNHIHNIFWDFLMIYQISLTSQVKQCAIITSKHGICELPHELPNDLRLGS